MAGNQLSKKLALDTNLLLDLAGRVDFAHEFKDSFQARGYVLYLPPTTVGELHENYVRGSSISKRELARVALLNIRRWDIVPFELASIEEGIAQQFARKILASRLLPAEEFNDALILAESALKRIPILVSSDKHLLDADEEALIVRFQEADLPPVHVVNPRRLIRALY